jgi:hypothetical protein
MKLLKQSQLALVMALGLSSVFSGSTFATQPEPEDDEIVALVTATEQLKLKQVTQPTALPFLAPEIWKRIFTYLSIKDSHKILVHVCCEWKEIVYATITQLSLAKKSVAQIIQIMQTYPKLHTFTYSFPQTSSINQIVSIAPKSCPNLQALYLNDSCNTTDPEFVTIISNCPQLEILQICGSNEITDEGLLSIAQQCSRLKEFYLSGKNKITYEGVQAFVKHFNGNLNSIEFFGCPNITKENNQTPLN